MLMPSPGWDEAVRTAYGDKVRTLERYSFSSESLSLDHLQAVADQCPATPMVRRVDVGIAQTTEAPFLSVGDFESAEDFTQRGIGFVMYDGETIIGGAYSSPSQHKYIVGPRGTEGRDGIMLWSGDSPG
jgi:hypothetical protein